MCCHNCLDFGHIWQVSSLHNLSAALLTSALSSAFRWMFELACHDASPLLSGAYASCVTIQAHMVFSWLSSKPCAVQAISFGQTLSSPSTAHQYTPGPVSTTTLAAAIGRFSQGVALSSPSAATSNAFGSATAPFMPTFAACGSAQAIFQHSPSANAFGAFGNSVSPVVWGQPRLF